MFVRNKHRKGCQRINIKVRLAIGQWHLKQDEMTCNRV